MSFSSKSYILQVRNQYLCDLLRDTQVVNMKFQGWNMIFLTSAQGLILVVTGLSYYMMFHGEKIIPFSEYDIHPSLSLSLSFFLLFFLPYFLPSLLSSLFLSFFLLVFLPYFLFKDPVFYIEAKVI